MDHMILLSLYGCLFVQVLSDNDMLTITSVLVGLEFIVHEAGLYPYLLVNTMLRLKKVTLLLSLF